MKTIVLMCGMVLLLFIAVSASADMISYQINVPNSQLAAFNPPFAPPYANVTVNRTGLTTAIITMTVASPPGFPTYAIGDGNAFDLNVNAAIFSTSGLSSGFSVAAPNQQVDGFGKFNLIIDDGSGFSSPYSTVSVTLTNLSGWASASDVLSDNKVGYLAAGHFGIYNPSAKDYEGRTGYAANGTSPTPIPEPATMIFMGAGLLGMAGFLRKKFKK
jgi:hypothetical protein